MRIVFDTEATGVPKNNWTDWSECHLVQLSWIVIDDSYKVLSSHSFIINSDYKSTESALNTHHITEEYRKEHGITFNEAMKVFMNDCDKCSAVICHMSFFDVGLLIKESQEHNIDISKLNRLKVIDTKLSTLYRNRNQTLYETVLAISPGFDPKLPDNSSLHDALYDSYLCLELYRKSPNKDEMTRGFKYYARRFN